LKTGPAEALFKPAFFEALQQALNPGGIICTQAECQWLHLDFIANVYRACCDLFPTVEYAYTAIPTYPSGQIGFMLLSNTASETLLRRPARAPNADVQVKLRFYNPALHVAAFALPEFARRKLEEARVKGGFPPRDPSHLVA
jgi:spermidine synthase